MLVKLHSLYSRRLFDSIMSGISTMGSCTRWLELLHNSSSLMLAELGGNLLLGSAPQDPLHSRDLATIVVDY